MPTPWPSTCGSREVVCSTSPAGQSPCGTRYGTTPTPWPRTAACRSSSSARRTSGKRTGSSRSSQRGTAPGLVHIFSVLEPCLSFKPWHDKKTGNFNGHNALAVKLARQGIAYQLVDNAFIDIADFSRAQVLADQIRVERLHRRLDRLARRFCPVLRHLPSGVHWGIHQAENATDIVFKRPEDLKPLTRRGPRAWITGSIAPGTAPARACHRGAPMRVLAAVLFGGVLLASPALAQAPPAPAPPAKAPAKAPVAKAPEYDVETEVTIKGVVEDFHESQMRGDHPGLHLIVKTETETIEVHACPVRFMKELDFTLEKGDAITVLGSRPQPDGGLVAREITKGQTSLILRDKTGAPVWTGR